MQQYAIGQELFSRPESEKLQYRAGLESGNYSGYRPLGAIETFPGMLDNVESYSVFKFLPDFKRVHPDVIERYSHEIENFSRYVHENIVHKLLLLVAVMLELPENYFVDAHKYEEHSGCHLRYMNYRARSPEENAKFQNLYSHSHTDFGTLTLLFRQPVAALQVQTPDGQWKYVKPYPGSITVNIADTLERWTNGFLPSSVHRVVAPPPDQAHIDRLGLMYFVRPPDNLHLATVDSPVLRREGFKRDDNENDEAITAGEWLKDRVKGIWVKPVVD
ncbi:putative oxidoreductase, 2OG-Fe(II) oxygenase family [Aspergillus melleus]|uniref:putative oxidoreductase, 2OG-Fe(II) oxygenase family n=1 Tax=Aspergillus melleus TaxID=138277 RepID=UPI001E8E1308|nr:uncharacterized protein LDX57_002705 [Aspergillus melleus]KAH8424959.1 hypothetical protein LDX57_002705 [Aspergillus melleus]